MKKDITAGQVKLVVNLVAATVGALIFIGRRIRAGEPCDMHDAADCVVAGQQFVVAVKKADMFNVKDLTS